MNEKEVQALIDAAITKNLIARMTEKWEIGTAHFLGDPTPPRVIVRKKRACWDLPQVSSGYYEQVVTVTLEELLMRIFDHCGITVEVKPATSVSWEIKRREDPPK